MKKQIFSIILLMVFLINALSELPVYAASPGVTTGSAVINALGWGTFEFDVTANGGYNITDCGIKYGTSSSNLSQTASYGYLGDNKGTFSVETSGLSLGTVYYYQAYAINENNESATGSVESVVIPGTFDITKPSNGASFSYGSDVTVEWEAAKEAVQYKLVMKDITAGEADASPVYIGTSTSYTIDAADLIGGHQYKIQVQARSVKNSDEIEIWASNGSEYYFYYKDIVSPGAFNITAPSNGASFNYNSSVKVSWSEATNAVQYELYMRDLSTNEDEGTVIYRGTSTSYTIPAADLYGGHEYKIHVKARSKAGSDVGITWSSNSDEEKVYTFYMKLNIPQITNPTNGGTLLLTSAIKWGSVSDASMYGLSLKDNVTGNELLESNGYPGYFLSSGETYCYLSNITWGDFSTDKLVANRSYTLTLRAYGEKSGYYTESSPVTFTFIEPTNPIVVNKVTNVVTATSFEALGEILTTTSAPLSEITDCGFYYRKSTSSTSIKVRLGKPIDTSFATKITGLEPNTQYTYAAYAANDMGEGVSPWATITTSAEDIEPAAYVLSVSPTTGNAKNVYTFSMDMIFLPDNAYLQFDNPATGEWFDEKYAVAAWAFAWQDYIITPEGFTITKDLNINTPGNADNNYKRKVRAIYYDSGIRSVTDPIEFTVKPNDEEIPAITVDDISYTINGKNLTITVSTSSAVEKLKLKNNQTTIDVFDAEYKTQSSGKRLWTITKPLDYYANKNLTFIPGSNEYGYSDASYDLFIRYDAPSSMGTLEIQSPQANAKHQKNQALKVSWRAPVTTPDSYTVTVSCDEEIVYTKEITATATNETVPGNCFVASGTYSISLTAIKNGYKNLSDSTEVYIEYEESTDTPIIPGDDLGTVEYGENPSYRQVYNYICNYVAGWGTTVSSPDYLHALFAMVWQESEWQQFEIVDGKSVPIIRRNKNGTYDVGITQVNSDSSGFAQAEPALRENWQKNLEFGIGRYNERYWSCMTDPVYMAVVEEGMQKTGVSKEEALARSAYAMYNGGKNVESAKRWYTLRDGASNDDPDDVKYYKQDNGYLNKYDQKPWEKETGIYIDDEKTTQISKPGIVEIGKDVIIEVKKTANKLSETIGYLAKDTATTILSATEGWLQIEGENYADGKTITGYVNPAYVSYDAAPVKKDSSFIGTVNKTSINIGEEVVFTVNATYGSSDFRICFDNQHEERVEMNYFGGVYNYARRIHGVGPRKVSMSWYEPSLEARITVDFPTIEVWIHGYGWTSSFNGKQLTVEQVYILGDERIEHGNNDVKYGLYIKNSEGIYTYGESEIKSKLHINKLGTWALYRDWDVMQELYLAPGTYEYGIVAIHGNNRRECKVSTFTLEQYNDKTERNYVTVSSGARVYDEAPDGSLKKNPYIELPYGQKVERIYGTEKGKKSRYVQVKFPWTGDDGVTYTYTMWVAASAIDTYNPLGLDMLYQKDGKTEYIASDYYINGSKGSSYYNDVMNVGLCDDYAENIVNIALSQDGYYEGDSVIDLSGFDKDGGKNNYTEYARWWTNGGASGGNKYHWCAYFVSWCARQAGISDKIIPNFENCGNGYSSFSESNQVDNPKRGDLVFYHCSICDRFTHVGIMINETETVEGNRGQQVQINRVDTYTDGHSKKYITRYYIRPSYSDNARLLQSLEEKSDAISYFISCFDVSGDRLKTLKGINKDIVIIEAPEKTDSINVRIPIDESQQFVTLYHAGQGYENDSKFNFTTNTISFKAIVKDLIGEGEYEFEFEIHRKASEETAIHYATVSYCNTDDEYIGGDTVDFENPETGNAPFTTSYVEFKNFDNENLTIEVSTGSYYEENVWFPISHKFDYIDEEQKFFLNVNDGTNVQTVEYTIARQAKSNDASLRNVFVSAYDENEELFASHAYVADNDVISIDLPYSTKQYSLNVEKSSRFATTEIHINNNVISGEDLIDVSKIEDSFITVVAEDGTTKKYELQIKVAQVEDVTAPVIKVVGESGTIYTSGSKITEMVTYSATDESWCETSLYFEGEALDELESISERGNYMIVATDVFGNRAEFSFAYNDGLFPLTLTTSKNTATYHKFYVSFEEPMDNATIYAAVYDADGRFLGVTNAPCDGDDYYIVNVPVQETTKTAKIFVWKDKHVPLAGVEMLNMQ